MSTHQHHGFQANLMMTLVCLGTSLVVGACFFAVGPITRRLGSSGISVVTKFMGLILLSISVGMLASGISGLFPGLAG